MNSQTIKFQNFKTDSVYYYKKKKNNKDSTLIATQYFDSLGKLIERDEYNFKGQVVKITNYMYLDELVISEETISKSPISINGSSVSKEVKTYDHDTSRNETVEKDYSFSDNSLKSPSVTVWNRDYDALGHLIREYYTAPSGNPYLYYVYYCSNGILNEIKSHDDNQNWIYSYLYEWDEKINTKTVYLYNTSKKLSQKLFYDSQKRLIMETNYEGVIPIYSDHTTRTNSYNSIGILESQTYQDFRGKEYYFKHFYSK